MENSMDRLVGALIGLARAAEGNEDLMTEVTDRVMAEGLAAGVTDTGSEERIARLIQSVQEEKKRLIPNCFSCAASCGRNDDYDMQGLWKADVEIRSIKSLILLGIQGIAARGGCGGELRELFCKALFAIGSDWNRDQLLVVAMEAGEAGAMQRGRR